jgi:hypothetical protein
MALAHEQHAGAARGQGGGARQTDDSGADDTD